VTELDPAVIAAWWQRQSDREGLPAKVTDPVVLAKIVTLAFVGREDAAESPKGGGGRVPAA
jgi:hypothetical protein